MSGSQTFRTVSPIDGSSIAEHRRDSDDDIERLLARSANAQIEWRQTPIIERTDALHRLADALRADRDQAADLITTEMGKRSVEALAEIDKSAWVCDYYADTAAGYLAPMTVDTGASTCFVQFPPLGTILAIMPWNYPVWQLMRAAAPAIAAGNAVILKHASNVTGSARLLLKIFDTAQMPASLLEVLVVDSSQVASVIADDRIAAVTLTGSETTGVAVATACASSLKKSVLELGGSDPFIVLEDADVEAAAKAAVTGRFLNTGQSCIAAKRFIVVESVAEAFETAFVKHTRSLVVGDPRDPATDIGPMARHDLRDELANQVQRGLEAGGRLLCGGTIPSGPGAFYAPTIVADVDPSNPLATEETFGPVAAVMRVADEQAAIAAANDSPYGLSASLWTGDPERARRLTSQISSGAVFVNAPSASDPRMPFGGVKRSGWGRELGSFGIREFVNIQGVTIAPVETRPGQRSGRNNRYGRRMSNAPFSCDGDRLRAQLGPIGVWTRGIVTTAAQRDAARDIEALGYGALWFSEDHLTREAFAHASLFLSATERITIATGIANIWVRDATAMVAGGATLAEAWGERFVLGIGVSHAPIVGTRGHAWGKPLTHMERYLDGMYAAPYAGPTPAKGVPLLLAALGPKMTALARDRSAGVHPYFVPPAHTAKARAILGAGPFLAPEQAVILETDPGRARGIAREHMKFYLALPNYTNNLVRFGFGEEDFADGGSDRLVDALVAWGDADAIAARVRAHHDAGADHVAIQALGATVDDAMQQLRTLAPVLLNR